MHPQRYKIVISNFPGNFRILLFIAKSNATAGYSICPVLLCPINLPRFLRHSCFPGDSGRPVPGISYKPDPCKEKYSAEDAIDDDLFYIIITATAMKEFNARNNKAGNAQQ